MVLFLGGRSKPNHWPVLALLFTGEQAQARQQDFAPRVLLRSSPRKRGPSLVLDSRLRGNGRSYAFGCPSPPGVEMVRGAVAGADLDSVRGGERGRHIDLGGDH